MVLKKLEKYLNYTSKMVLITGTMMVILSCSSDSIEPTDQWQISNENEAQPKPQCGENVPRLSKSSDVDGRYVVCLTEEELKQVNVSCANIDDTKMDVLLGQKSIVTDSPCDRFRDTGVFGVPRGGANLCGPIEVSGECCYVTDVIVAHCMLEDM